MLLQVSFRGGKNQSKSSLTMSRMALWALTKAIIINFNIETPNHLRWLWKNCLLSLNSSISGSLRTSIFPCLFLNTILGTLVVMVVMDPMSGNLAISFHIGVVIVSCWADSMSGCQLHHPPRTNNSILSNVWSDDTYPDLLNVSPLP